MCAKNPLARRYPNAKSAHPEEATPAVAPGHEPESHAVFRRRKSDPSNGPSNDVRRPVPARLLRFARHSLFRSAAIFREGGGLAAQTPKPLMERVVGSPAAPSQFSARAIAVPSDASRVR